MGVDKVQNNSQLQAIINTADKNLASTLDSNANVPTFLDTSNLSLNSVFTYNNNNNFADGILPMINSSTIGATDGDFISALTADMHNTIRQCDELVRQGAVQMQQSKTQTSSGNTQNSSTINLNNGADVFKKFTSENLSEMKNLSDEIKSKQEEFNKAKKLVEESTDDNAKKAAKEKAKGLAKQLNELRDKYSKLDKKYGGGTSLASKYGKSSDFYSNLHEDELKTIEDVNADIDRMKSELKSKEDELKRLQQQELDKLEKMCKDDKNNSKKYQELRQKGDLQGIKDMVTSKDDQKTMKDLEDAIQQQKEDITKEIDTLSSYIRAAAKDDGDPVDYETHKADSETKAKEDKKSSDAKEAAKGIAGALFDDKGQAKSESAIVDALKEQFKDNDAYNEDTIKNVAKFIHSQIGTKSKDAFLTDLDKGTFFNKLINNSDNINFVGDDDASKANLRLLVQTYGVLKGDTDAFENNAKKLKDSKDTAPTIKPAIKLILDKVAAAKKSEEPAKKKAVSPTLTADAKKTKPEPAKKDDAPKAAKPETAKKDDAPKAANPEPAKNADEPKDTKTPEKNETDAQKLKKYETAFLQAGVKTR